jgi:hypothetical protein
MSILALMENPQKGRVLGCKMLILRLLQLENYLWRGLTSGFLNSEGEKRVRS